MIKRTQDIKSKGFDMSEESLNPSFVPVDFSKIKLGTQTLTDAVIEIGNYKDVKGKKITKEDVMNAIAKGDLIKLRDYSNLFFRISGIYARLCRYMAGLYRYDWFVTPFIYSENLQQKKAIDGFQEVLGFLDDFNAKKTFTDISLKVIKNGCYYGYKVFANNTVQIQELPINYCRAEFTINNRPVVEFNMKYFDDCYTDEAYRKKIIGMFPEEFAKGYKLYKAGKLKPHKSGDDSGWYILDTKMAFKFNIGGSDVPFFIATIPAIIDLDEATDLTKKKMAMQLLKIIIQKMPIDKNGDLVFDVEEAMQLHQNVKRMIGDAFGLEVITTFAEVDVADMADNSTNNSAAAYDQIKNAVNDEAGISSLLFNADGNITLDKSIINDEASIWNLVLSYQIFLNDCISKFNKSPKKIKYKVEILPTTIYNYKELAKQYKENMQVGFSKMLPQVAMGQSQSTVLATAFFENDYLDLINVFIPPLISSTMNPDMLKARNGGLSEEKESGRPTKESQGETVSDKTIQNRESQN